MKKHYPRQLSYGANNIVIAVSDTEVGKLFANDTRSDIGSEAEKMKFANQINRLVVQFVRLDEYDEQTEMLVMERIYPIDFRAYEYERRQLWFELMESELQQLHKAGFVHRDLRRPDNVKGLPYDNILLTNQGLRLIDVGISALRHQLSPRLFDRFVSQELQELQDFKHYFLDR